MVAALEAGPTTSARSRRAAGLVVARSASRLLNRLRERTTQIRITDQGCMLRGYDRRVVDAINRCHEVTHLRAGAGLHVCARSDRDRSGARGAGRRRVEVLVAASHPTQLRSHDRLLAAAAADFSWSGMLIAGASLLFVLYPRGAPPHRRPGGGGPVHPVRHRVLSARMLLLGLGMVGEYVGRIFEQVRSGRATSSREVIGDDSGPDRVAALREPRREHDAPSYSATATSACAALRVLLTRVGRAARRHARRRSRGAALVCESARRCGRTRILPVDRTPPGPDYRALASPACPGARLHLLVLLRSSLPAEFLAAAPLRSAQHARLAAAAVSWSCAGQLGDPARRERDRRDAALHGVASPTPVTSSISTRSRSRATTPLRMSFCESPTPPRGC